MPHCEDESSLRPSQADAMRLYDLQEDPVEKRYPADFWMIEVTKCWISFRQSNFRLMISSFAKFAMEVVDHFVRCSKKFARIYHELQANNRSDSL